jgi:flavin reductase (DIM6/NTAB) family NADH-FMN oxidoreductase RutF
VSDAGRDDPTTTTTPTPPDEDLRNTVGRALGRIPSGLFVLSVLDGGGGRYGMLASWVQQAAFEPLAVSLAIARDRPMRDTIVRTRRFALSVISAGDTDLLRRFARQRGPEHDPFEGLDVIPTPSGIPVVAGALAWLDCELLQAVEFGADHDVMIAGVTAGQVLRQGQSFTHVRGSGLHY